MNNGVRDEIRLLSPGEFRDSSPRLASKYSLTLEALDRLYQEARADRAKELEAPGFLGFQDLEQVRDRLQQLEPMLRADIGAARSPEYADAAAALLYYDPMGFDSLVSNLKSRQLGVTSWKAAIQSRVRAEKERLAASGYNPGGNKPESQVTMLTKLARANAKLFHVDQEPYATVEVDQHLEHYKLSSRAFKFWLSQLFFDRTKSGCQAQAMSAAIATLSGFAVHEPARQTFVRVAGWGGAVYLDLCNDKREVVEIDAAGWRVIDSKQVPVIFLRHAGMLPLPIPIRGGSLEPLKGMINTPQDASFKLAIAWLVGVLNAFGAYPWAEITGESGSGKSTAQRVLRSMVDPNEAPLRQPPRDSQTLFIAAQNSWVISLENVSFVPDWLSDTICRLSTGASNAARMLYTDDEEKLIRARRPGMLNGIEELARQPDLIQRLLPLTQEFIPDEKRLTDADVDDAIERERPGILGCLLDAVSMALRRLPEVEGMRLPRMASFIQWIEAASPSLGWAPGEFLRLYDEAMEQLDERLLTTFVARALENHGLRLWEADPLAEKVSWSGTAQQLLDIFNSKAPVETRESKFWPKDPTRLSGKLRRLTPNLRRQDVILIDFDEKARPRRVTITYTRKFIQRMASDYPANGAAATINFSELASADKSARQRWVNRITDKDFATLLRAGLSKPGLDRILRAGRVTGMTKPDAAAWRERSRELRTQFEEYQNVRDLMREGREPRNVPPPPLVPKYKVTNQPTRGGARASKRLDEKASRSFWPD